jgi:hypothetical protein
MEGRPAGRIVLKGREAKKEKGLDVGMPAQKKEHDRDKLPGNTGVVENYK